MMPLQRACGEKQVVKWTAEGAVKSVGCSMLSIL